MADREYRTAGNEGNIGNEGLLKQDLPRLWPRNLFHSVQSYDRCTP